MSLVLWLPGVPPRLWKCLIIAASQPVLAFLLRTIYHRLTYSNTVAVVSCIYREQSKNKHFSLFFLNVCLGLSTWISDISYADCKSRVKSQISSISIRSISSCNSYTCCNLSQLLCYSIMIVKHFKSCRLQLHEEKVEGFLSDPPQSTEKDTSDCFRLLKHVTMQKEKLALCLSVLTCFKRRLILLLSFFFQITVVGWSAHYPHQHFANFSMFTLGLLMMSHVLMCIVLKIKWKKST